MVLLRELKLFQNMSFLMEANTIRIPNSIKGDGRNESTSDFKLPFSSNLFLRGTPCLDTFSTCIHFDVLGSYTLVKREYNKILTNCFQHLEIRINTV